ncbi:23S rRNA (cytidine2498-2'-O)-methyltransferase [Myxococcus fulvus]|uniref:23S rRNA (Cytidine2498-2'-O)-methyltransferase n=1 Tax=Myxococcus fulvus TaxID=33 RepID=A0A511T9T7_MYXFU|nr:23S rRNA (cytidine(2498)-2'-O)-methyltransferase RlmM [Myxococcus fulvus]GEN10955.1 ribosomal RNA large subunit methyltransferase M [Myxococcus fulvus]SET37942.1 23S rRNA (cytidine2498-2'-O)-methyltransferase [Myxococcus fulvus]
MPAQTQPPVAGRWLWTCRAGFESHLFEELAWAGAAPRLLGDALVESERSPSPPPAFARAGYQVVASLPPGAPEVLAEAAARSIGVLPGAGPWVLQSFTPDSPRGNPLATTAEALEAAVKARLPSERLLEDGGRAKESGARLVALCVAPDGVTVVGSVFAREALSLAPGGRRRMRREVESPSRAAMKLEEALDGLAFEPGRGDVCVDLGAAPGGWTQRLVARGARVVAVDPAKLMPELASHGRVKHVQESAFAYAPEEPADWLFCDMAWRPLEVAQLLAKWGRRGWASHLVANIKLPMKDKNPVLVRVRHTLVEEGGWEGLTVRQLYHDRDEVTVTAHRLR